MSNKTASKNNKLMEQIYIQHKDQLYNYILRLSNDQHLAQDIVQHTFYKVLSDPEITRVKHLKAYLFAIAHNKLKDEWKRKPTVPFDGDDTMQDTPDFKTGATPEEITEAGTSNTSVEKTIRQMPKNFSELMLLRYTEDLSIAEIAEITHRSVTDIKVSLHRARLKFEALHTASMYSKIAVSRNRCETVQELLLPFHDNDLTTEQLIRVNKHITKCNICAKDAAEMKRTRQLFVALPLIPFPLAFDEFSRQMLQLSSATTAGVQASDGAANIAENSSANGEVITQTIEQTVRIKIAAGIAGAVILAGSGLYLAGMDSDPATSTQTDEKNILKQQEPQTKTPADKNKGSIILTAKLSPNSQQKLKNIKWKIEPVNKQQPEKPVDTPATKMGNNITFTLPPGSYKVTATLDNLKKSETITIEKGKSSTKPVIFNAGEISVSAPPDKDIDTGDIQWRLYKENVSSENPVATFTGNFKKYFPAGKYLLQANYQGHLRKQHTIILSPGKLSSVVKPGFRYGKLNLQASLEGSEKILESTEIAQWSVGHLKNGEIDKSNVVEIKKGTSTVLLSPGTYRINLALGKYVNQSTDVIISEGKTSSSTGLSLNVGKLTLQAKITLDNSLLPIYINWKIDNLDASNNKKTNMEKSEINNSANYYLPPGKYKITAIYGTNLKLVKTVTIETGKTAVKDNFRFTPGVVDFTTMDSSNKQTIYNALDWSLEQQTTKGGDIYTQLTHVKTSRAIFTLQPGHYRITVEHEKNGRLMKEFDIAPGQVTKDTLMFNQASQAPRWEWK